MFNQARREAMCAAQATTWSARASSERGGGKRNEGPWMWTAAMATPGGVVDGRRDRRDAVGELIADPGVAITPHVGETRTQRLPGR